MGNSPRILEFGREIRRREVWIPLMIAVVLLAGAWTRRWIADDGFIYLRIVDNILEGDGPVFNQGLRVEAGTSPLWTAIVALLAWLLPVSLESLVVGLSLALSTFGTWAAARASMRISSGHLPYGLAAFVATPLVWDFSTSGLETSLTLAFLGASALTVARLEAAQPERSKHLWGVALLGLGPLVRPDLAVASAAFIAVGISIARRRGHRVLPMLTSALALPLLVQITRMGYFRSFLPNTALAKEAGTGDWWSGVQYLADTLLIPSVAFIACSVIVSLDKHRVMSATRLAILVAAGLHGVTILYVGGDFMRLRLFLPTVLLLAILATGTSNRIQLTGLAVTLVATAVILQLPPTYDSLITSSIQDQRAIAAQLFGAHPLAKSDIPPDHQFAEVLALREAKPGGLIEVPLGSSDPIVHVSGDGILIGPVGMVGFYAGSEVMIWDRFALSDPIGARFEPKATDRRKGHEKYVQDEWFDARLEGNPLGSDEAEAAAFLECPRIDALITGITAPLTAVAFWHNLTAALPDTFLRFPSDPVEALAVCEELS